jgi:hypothetical protein
LETLSATAYSDLVGRVAPSRRWDAGVELVLDALLTSEASAGQEAVAAIAQSLHHDFRPSVEHLAQTRAAVDALTRAAQSHRAADNVLGEHGDESAAAREADDPLAHLAPLRQARACAALAVLLEGALNGMSLSEDELADIAYDHYCASEELTITEEILVDFC